MTRGRKKDLTIPPTRSLVQQRDYRARKAQYITSLEERCRKAEDENAQLRKELAEARARLANPAVLLPETAAASQELMKHLSQASVSLAKFHRLAFPDGQGINTSATPLHFQQPTPSTTFLPDSATPTTFAPQPLVGGSQTSRGRKQLYVDESPPPFSPRSQARSTPGSFRSPTPSSNGECCGGIFDCDKLECDNEEHKGGTLRRTSGLRSTTGDDDMISDSNDSTD